MERWMEKSTLIMTELDGMNEVEMDTWAALAFPPPSPVVSVHHSFFFFSLDCYC